MKKVLLALVLTLLFCSALAPPIMQRTTIQDTAMEIAIADYLEGRLSKPFNVFTVSMYEKGEYDRYEISDEVIVIDISPAFRKVYLTPVDTVGSVRVPTRHIIRDGKLFYWHDPDYGLTEEMIQVLHRFNIVDSVGFADLFATQDERIDGYHLIEEKSKRGTHYYFCENDPSNYKRVITSTSIGWYRPPTIRCR